MSFIRRLGNRGMGEPTARDGAKGGFRIAVVSKRGRGMEGHAAVDRWLREKRHQPVSSPAVLSSWPLPVVGGSLW